MAITTTVRAVTNPNKATDVDASSPASISAFVASQETKDTEVSTQLVPDINAVGTEINSTATTVNNDATTASNAATAASNSETAAALSETQAGNYAASYSAASTSSTLIGTGAKTFTVQSGKLFVTGQFLLISSDADSTKYMHGHVTSYSGTTLIMNITNTGSSGTFADWNVAISGSRGAVGGGLTDLESDGLPKLGNFLDTNSYPVKLSKGADIASATVLPTIPDGNYADVTGTTTVTSIATTGKIGTVVKYHFDGILTLTHHATDLILPGGANITTAVGDEAEFVEYATGDFRCTSYTKADGTPVISDGGGAWDLLQTLEASASSTVDLETTFDSTYDHYVIVADEIVVSDTGNIRCRLKINGTYQTGSDYLYHVTRPNDVSATYAASVSSTDTSIIVVETATGAGNSSNFTMEIPRPASTASHKSICWKGGMTQVSNVIRKHDGYGACKSGTQALTGVRFFPGTGTITSGRFSLYGIKKA